MNCPICKTHIEDKDFIKIFIFPYNNQEYKLYRCSDCGLEFWTPLKIIPEFYENEVFPEYLTIHNGLRDLRDALNCQKSFFKYFPLKKGKLLDVGCGDGIFLREAQEFGFEVYGIDFDSKSIKIAKERFGLKNVLAMNLEQFFNYARKNNLKFDVITFFEVLEHQDDPEGFLTKIRNLLKDSGYIAGSIPNRKRFSADLERKYFYGDFPPHHFLWFSKDVLITFLRRMNFISIEIYPIKFLIFEISALLELKFLGSFSKNIKEKFEKLENRKTRLIIIKFLKFLKILRNLFFSPLALIFSLISNKEGKGIYFQAKICPKYQ